MYESLVDIFERGRRGCGREDGKAEAVSLIDIVVGVLSYYHGFDSGERRVTGPIYSIVSAGGADESEGLQEKKGVV